MVTHATPDPVSANYGDPATAVRAEAVATDFGDRMAQGLDPDLVRGGPSDANGPQDSSIGFPMTSLGTFVTGR